MKKLFLFLQLMLISFFSFSQNIFSGKIVHAETGETVAGAVFQKKGTYAGISSDENGNFSLSLKDSAADFVISHLAFENREVRARAGEEQIISLQPKLFLADEVIVSATRGAEVTAPTYEEVSRAEIQE